VQLLVERSNRPKPNIVETIQLREGCWVMADLEGKGSRIRTVAIPVWVKHGISAWMTSAGVEGVLPVLGGRGP